MAQILENDENVKELLQVVQKVLQSGRPVEFELQGKRLTISVGKEHSKLGSLESHPNFVVGDPEELVHIDWSTHWDSTV